ncbi:Hypothetical predicted protein [Podarcis lilfordi]|uniref:Uncharacterized protein n=1 Tax=Podarcis lilfordi TaxID=74358 RepID=A0AA35LB74_9SAUR|nr:Hypothetical predicted protein [Podarcis lilfordi]
MCLFIRQYNSQEKMVDYSGEKGKVIPHLVLIRRHGYECNNNNNFIIHVKKNSFLTCCPSKSCHGLFSPENVYLHPTSGLQSRFLSLKNGFLPCHLVSCS